MKIILMNALSTDGYTATLKGDSDWVLDGDEFETHVRRSGCIIMGRTTFDQYKGEIFPIDGAINFVCVSNPKQYEAISTNELRFISGNPAEIISIVAQEGRDTAILGGGGKVNGSFAAAGLIDEIILDVHPIVLGSGLKLFGNWDGDFKLKLIESKRLDNGIVQNHYRVLALDE